MQKFLNLPPDKQERIINASLSTFGNSTYKKASINDIAVSAGISKGMVFHYFGSKKELYLYLLNLCGDTLSKEYKNNPGKNTTDIFEKIKAATAIKIAVIKKHPNILAFLLKAYHETDPEVSNEAKSIISPGVSKALDELINDTDTSNFKNPKDLSLIIKLLLWAGEGALKNNHNLQDIEQNAKEYYACIDLLKNIFTERTTSPCPPH